MMYFSRWKIAFVIVTALVGLLLAMPNLVPESTRLDEDGNRKGIFGVLPHKTINLGLDLQGGSHLLYEADIEFVKRERLEGTQEEAIAALRTAQIATDGVVVEAGRVIVAVRDPGQLDAALSALRELSQPVGDAIGALAPQTLEIAALDGQRISLTMTQAAIEDIQDRTMRQSKEVITRRIDSFGTSDPTVARQGDDRLLVQVPGVDDPERLKAAIGTTAKLTFHMVVSDDPADIARAEQGRVSPFQLLLPTESPTEPKLLVQRRAALAGENLRNSSQGFDSQGGEPVVNFSFDTAGATTFCKLTRDNIRKRFAVVLDGTIITAPSIRSAICGGTGFIEGNFTVESASDLAALLNAGALPAPLTIVEERTVGAGLGQDSIDAGRVALIIGFISVMVFMLIAYSLFGLFSNIALLLNVALIAGALSALGATLTLPGIAGIVLTIGMAVDANVLIYERIREEIRSGRSVMNALEAGYAHAQSAIVDANVTTFIAAAILFFLGSGPVQGFAVTLGIGIVTSVFTAFVVTRLMVVLWYQVARPRALPI